MSKSLDVMVVDDQPGVRQLLGIIIRELGDRVKEAQNGSEAVNLVRRWKPDLVFMDIRMPVMGGVEALERIKLIRPELTVIMMTAYGSDEALEDLRKKGALMCLTKPFDVDYIKQLLEDFRHKKEFEGLQSLEAKCC